MISPVEDCHGNNSYHGYHPVRPLVINPRFGTNEDLKNLVGAFKKRGIGTILDYIPTHISSASELFKAKCKTPEGRRWFAMKELFNDPVYGEYIGDLEFKLTDGNTKNLNEVNQSEEYLGFFGLESLPLFNLCHPEVVEWHCHRIKALVEEYGFSDVRIDAGFIQPRGKIKLFMEALKNIPDEQVSVLPEYWSYYDSVPGECYGFSDGEFDIAGTIYLNNYLRDPGIIFKLRQHFFRINDLDKTGYNFIVGLSNHDLPRMEGELDILKMAALINFTIPNFTPIIYYGEEVPMRAINDGKDRIAISSDIMDFGCEPRLFDFYRLLAKFRKENYAEEVHLTNFRVNDTNFGREPLTNLISYNLHCLKSGSLHKSYHVAINRENRDKPVNLGLLFSNDDVLPTDSLSGRDLVGVGGDKFIVEANKCYILTDRRNNF